MTPYRERDRVAAGTIMTGKTGEEDVKPQDLILPFSRYLEKETDPKMFYFPRGSRKKGR